MRMDLGTRNTLLYDFMHCMTAVSLEMSDEPNICLHENNLAMRTPLRNNITDNYTTSLLLCVIFTNFVHYI